MNNISKSSPIPLLMVFIFLTASILAAMLAYLNQQALLLYGFAALATLAIACGFGVYLLWQAPPLIIASILGFEVMAIDLGMDAVGLLPLIVKSLAYGAAIIIGLKAINNGRGFTIETSRIFLVYTIFAWITIAQSNNPISVLHTGVALVALALTSIAIEQLKPSEALKITGWLSIYIGVGSFISLLIYFLLPNTAIAVNVAGTGRTGGIYGSPNSFGAVAAVGVIVSLSAIRYSKVRVSSLLLNVLLALFSVAGLLISGSRTALVAAILTIAIVFFINKPWVALSFAVAVATITFGLSLFDSKFDLITLGMSSLSRTTDSSDVRTLTGRLEIWKFAYTQWTTQPWFGFGLGESRKVISQGWANHWGGTTASAHNLVLESLLNVGLVGTALLAVVVLTTFKKIINTDSFRNKEQWILRKMGLSFLLFALIQGITEKSFGGTASMSTGILAMTIGYATVYFKKIKVYE